MPTTKKSPKERIAKYRQSLKERGGMEVVVPLEKEAADQLKALKEYYGGKSYGEVITLALNVLDKTKSLIPRESELRVKHKGEVDKK
jgi:hypothetical protein